MRMRSLAACSFIDYDFGWHGMAWNGMAFYNFTLLWEKTSKIISEHRNITEHVLKIVFIIFHLKHSMFLRAIKSVFGM